MSAPNVQRKLKAAALYCVRINSLPADKRNNENWSYALIGQNRVEQYIKANGTVAELLTLAKVTQVVNVQQQKLI